MPKKFAMAGALLLVLAVGGIAIADALKARPGFCVSCHLDAGTPLHAEKHRQFIQEIPLDLAGYHRRKVPGELGCPGCHDGRKIGTKARVLWVQVKNTFLYVFGNTDEPKTPDPALMPDDNCDGCHREMKKDRGGFHGFAAHRPKVKVSCISCHGAHVKGSADRFFIDGARLMAACKKCHVNIPGGFQLLSRQVN